MGDLGTFTAPPNTFTTLTIGPRPPRQVDKRRLFASTGLSHCQMTAPRSNRTT